MDLRGFAGWWRGRFLETGWMLEQVLTEHSGPVFYGYGFGDGWIQHLGTPQGTLTGPTHKSANAGNAL